MGGAGVYFCCPTLFTRSSAAPDASAGVNSGTSSGISDGTSTSANSHVNLEPQEPSMLGTSMKYVLGLSLSILGALATNVYNYTTMYLTQEPQPGLKLNSKNQENIKTQ